MDGSLGAVVVWLIATMTGKVVSEETGAVWKKLKETVSGWAGIDLLVIRPLGTFLLDGPSMGASGISTELRTAPGWARQINQFASVCKKAEIMQIREYLTQYSPINISLNRFGWRVN